MTAIALPKRPKTSVPGQYLGYSLQEVRLCRYLLTVEDGRSVSIEHLDDVAVHSSDGKQLLEQAKSALTTNPLTDRHTALWNTLANWATMCSDGTVEIESTWFRLYVTPRNAGDLASSMAAATDTTAAAEVLTKIKKLFPKNATATAGANPLVRKFLAAGDDTCAQIITRMSIVTEDDPLDSIRAALRATLAEELLDDFAAAAIGMAKAEAEKIGRAGAPPIVDAAAYRRRFQAFVRKHNLSNLLVPTMPAPSPVAIEEEMGLSPIYIQQLRAIEASDDLVVTAISDVLRTKADKIGWAADGSIVDTSLDELDDDLIRHHKLARDEVEDVQASLSPAVRGRHLYRNCIRLVRPLEGRSLPDHFIPGAFNCLADVVTIGWHPDYLTMFKDQ